MKTTFALLLLGFSCLCVAQDDDYCICMLDQPAYDAALGDSFASTNEFTNLLFPQPTTNPTQSLVLLQQEEVENELEEEMDIIEADENRSPDKNFIKKKKKKRIPNWNAHKRPKKYRGKCPFF